MRDALRRSLVRLAWPLVAVVPALVAARGMFSTSEVFCYRELALIFFPADVWARRTIASGDAPLWDPYLALGQSAVAEPWRHLLFPPAMLLRLLPVQALGFNLWIGLPYPTAALGAYLLLRTRVAPSAAALGAMIYSVSSTFLSAGNMPNLSWSAALAPWTIWAAWEAARSRRGERAALAALAAGMQCLGGEPVTLAATFAVALAYVAVSCDSLRESTEALVRTALVLAAGCALCAVQFLPFAEAVGASTSAGPSASFADWSLHPARLLEAIVPLPYVNAIATPPEYASWGGVLSDGRDPFLASHYVGIPAIALAAVGAVSGGQRFARFWLAVLGAALVCALGGHTPVYPAVARVLVAPQYFRFPEKFALVAVLALAALAAEGWEVLATRRLEGWERWVLPGVVVALLAAVVAAGAAAPSLAAATGADPSAAEHTRTVLSAATPLLVGLSLGVLGVSAALSLSPRRRRAALALGFGLVALDLLGAGAWLNPQIPVDLIGMPAWVAGAAPSSGRFYSGITLANLYVAQAGRYVPEIKSDPDSLSPSISAPEGTPYYSLTAMTASTSAIYESRWGLRGVFTVDTSLLMSREYHEFEGLFLREQYGRRAVALDRVGVRTQLRRSPPLGTFRPGEPVPYLGAAVVYTSDEPFSRAFVASSSRVEPAAPAAMERLFDPDFEFKRVALVDRDTLAAGEAGAAAAPSARIVEDRTNLVRVHAEGGEGATLVLLDSYNPGWVAEVDGRPAEIARVDGLFRGVRLAAGAHDVTFRFRPRSLVAGAWLSGVTALALAVLAVVSVARRRRRRVTPEPEAV